MNCAEYGSSSDEHIPSEYDQIWTDWKDVIDPDFEILQKSMGDHLRECIDESPEKTYSCDVCGMEVTEFELAINGACPGCDSKINDVPF
jgi:hypothetical protein